MDAFDRILKRTPNVPKGIIEKKLSITNRIIEILDTQSKTQCDLARALVCDSASTQNIFVALGMEYSYNRDCVGRFIKIIVNDLGIF